MKLALFFILLALIFLHLIFSVLALFQANRFKSLSRNNPWVTWGYISITLVIDATILAVFWGIEF